MIDIYSIEVLCFYLYNRAPLAVITDLFGEIGEDKPCHHNYAKEEVELLLRGIHSLWGWLDTAHKRKLLSVAQSFADRQGFDPHESIHEPADPEETP